MPLEHLERLFEEIGQTAERLSRLRGLGEAAAASRVGRSESVGSIADLYAQLGREQMAPLVKPIERLAQQLEKLNRRLESEKKEHGEASGAGGGWWRRMAPRHMLDPFLRFSNYVAAQQAAGRPVDPLTYGAAWASRFFYSFSTGRVVMPSGRAIPWRRALAARLRGRGWARPLRKALLGPDIAMRRVRLAWTAAQGGRAVGAGVRAAAAAGRLGMLAAGAGAGGAGGAGAAGAGAAGAAGAAGLGAASIAGIVVGAFVALVAAVIAGTIALGKFVGAVRESAAASLDAKRQYAETTPAMAAVMSQKDVLEMREKARRGQMMAPLAQLELASYQRWTEGTRHIELLGETITSGFKIALQEMILNHPLIRSIETIAAWIIRKFGLEDQTDAHNIPAMLRALDVMRKGQAEATMGSDFYRWPRQAPPEPINRGPGEK